MHNVLIVDDEEWIRSVLKEYLEELDYAVDLASTLAEARLHLARVPLPEAVVLDMTLPDGNGWSLLKEMRSEPRTADVPVLLFTAHVLREEDSRLLHGHGKADFLPKPFKLVEFRSRLERCLGAAPSAA